MADWCGGCRRAIGIKEDVGRCTKAVCPNRAKWGVSDPELLNDGRGDPPPYFAARTPTSDLFGQRE